MSTPPQVKQSFKQSRPIWNKINFLNEIEINVTHVTPLLQSQYVTLLWGMALYRLIDNTDNKYIEVWIEHSNVQFKLFTLNISKLQYASCQYSSYTCTRIYNFFFYNINMIVFRISQLLDWSNRSRKKWQHRITMLQCYMLL